MSVTAVMQAIAVTQAASNGTDDSMTARNSRNESKLSKRRKVPEKDSKKEKLPFFVNYFSIRPIDIGQSEVQCC
jgi:hypothetical protein